VPRSVVWQCPAKHLEHMLSSEQRIDQTIEARSGNGQRFARTAARPEDYHRRSPRAAALDRIFRLESERTISEDWVVRYDNRFFQLQPESRHYAPAQGKVLVCEGRHGNVAIEYRGRALRWQEIAAPSKPTAAVQRASEALSPVARRKWVPPANHPWREAARRAVEKRERNGSAVPRPPSLARPCASP